MRTRWPNPVSESHSPVDVPEDSDGMVDFDRTAFGVGLSGDQDADATRRGDTVVFAGTDTASSTVVTPTAEGVQIMTVLDSQAADTSPTYALELPAGGTAHPLPDGKAARKDACVKIRSGTFWPSMDNSRDCRD